MFYIEASIVQSIDELKQVNVSNFSLNFFLISLITMLLINIVLISSIGYNHIRPKISLYNHCLNKKTWIIINMMNIFVICVVLIKNILIILAKNNQFNNDSITQMMLFIDKYNEELLVLIYSIVTFVMFISILDVNVRKMILEIIPKDDDDKSTIDESHSNLSTQNNKSIIQKNLYHEFNNKEITEVENNQITEVNKQKVNEINQSNKFQGKGVKIGDGNPIITEVKNQKINKVKKQEVNTVNQSNIFQGKGIQVGNGNNFANQYLINKENNS